MLKALIRTLFGSDQEKRTLNNKNIHRSSTTKTVLTSHNLEKGQVHAVLMPELEGQKGFKLSKWYVTPGTIVKTGAVVCEIENKNITIEYESIYSGRILATCKLHQELISGMEIFKIEGL